MGAIRMGPTVTIAEVFERFLRVDAQNVRASSRRRYQRLVRRFIIPQLGVRLVAKIGTAAIREHLAELAAQGVSHSTLRGVRQMILQGLRAAAADDIAVLAVLDTRRIVIPRTATPPRRIIPVEEGELRRLLEASPWPWRCLWAVLFYAGCRIAEGLALTWSDFDLVGRRVTIARQAIGGELVLPKTAGSVAERPLLPELEAILADYRPHWQANELGLLFANRHGRPYLQDNVRRRVLHPALDLIGAPRRSFHCFRHGLTAHLFRLGVGADVVQKMLRHSSLATTQRYTHTRSDELRTAIDAAIERQHLPKESGSGGNGRQSEIPAQQITAIPP